MTLKSTIEALWEDRQTLSPESPASAHGAVQEVLTALNTGQLRVAEKRDGLWVVNAWIKQAILLSFRLRANHVQGQGPLQAYDKVPLKTAAFTEAQYQEAGFRQVPGALVREGAYVGKDVVLMPSFINIGAYVDAGTMIDTWATVGSCAQVGKRCHISGGTGLGGVLEPLHADPVIIEDDCFIGARSEIVEGVRVGQGAVIGMGVFIGASTPIVDRETGEIFKGEVPPYAVVMAGSMPSRSAPQEGPTPHLNCAVIVKRVDAQTRAKTALNELLRDAT